MANGKGYPQFGEKYYNVKTVPEYVWIISYADKFDAAINERSYKNTSKTLKEAWAELAKSSKNGELPYDFAPIYKEIILEMDIFEDNYNDLDIKLQDDFGTKLEDNNIKTQNERIIT